MADKNKHGKHQGASRSPAGEGPFDWDNFLGITAPSKTARSLMGSEGYVAARGAKAKKRSGRIGR